MIKPKTELPPIPEHSGSIKQSSQDKIRYKYRCETCYSVWDFQDDREVVYPCPICGDYATIQHLQESNQLFEIAGGDLRLINWPVSDEERKSEYLKKEKRRYEIILCCLKRNKAEVNLEAVAKEILTQIKGW